MGSPGEKIEGAEGEDDSSSTAGDPAAATLQAACLELSERERRKDHPRMVRLSGGLSNASSSSSASTHARTVSSGSKSGVRMDSMFCVCCFMPATRMSPPPKKPSGPKGGSDRTRAPRRQHRGRSKSHIYTNELLMLEQRYQQEDALLGVLPKPPSGHETYNAGNARTGPALPPGTGARQVVRGVNSP